MLAVRDCMKKQKQVGQSNAPETGSPRCLENLTNQFTYKTAQNVMETDAF